MSLESVLPLMLVLAQIAVVVTRPNGSNGYYCNIPCPLTNPCECQGQGQNYPLTVRVTMDQGQAGGYNGGYNGDMTRSGAEGQQQSPPPPPPTPLASPQPPPEQKKRSGGLLSSLLNIPGAIADTILSGEVTL